MSRIIKFQFSGGNRVQGVITGEKGSGCANFMSALNKNLGSRLESSVNTEEFYESPDPQSTTTTEHTDQITN